MCVCVYVRACACAYVYNCVCMNVCMYVSIAVRVCVGGGGWGCLIPYCLTYVLDGTKNGGCTGNSRSRQSDEQYVSAMWPSSAVVAKTLSLSDCLLLPNRELFTNPLFSSTDNNEPLQIVTNNHYQGSQPVCICRYTVAASDNEVYSCSTSLPHRDLSSHVQLHHYRHLLVPL